MATRSICLCIVLLKLNLTEIVDAVRIVVKSALSIVGGINSRLYKESAQTLRIFFTVIFVNKLEISKEQTKKASESNLKCYIFSAKLKESSKLE